MKNKLFIYGTIAFLIIAGLVWNYTEAVKEKNTIELKRISSQPEKNDDNSSSLDFQQKEKCLELKRGFIKNNPNVVGRDGIAVVQEDVVYSKEDDTCYLFLKELQPSTNGEVETKEYIIDLLTEKDIGFEEKLTNAQFQEKKKNLGF